MITSLDFDNAFNSIDRAFVKEALIDTGLDLHILRFLLNYYDSVKIEYQNQVIDFKSKMGFYK